MYFFNNFSEYFLILIVFLPLIGSIVAGFGSFFIGTNGALLVTISLISFSTLISYTALYTIGLKSQIVYIDLLT